MCTTNRCSPGADAVTLIFRVEFCSLELAVFINLETFPAQIRDVLARRVSDAYIRKHDIGRRGDLEWLLGRRGRESLRKERLHGNCPREDEGLSAL